MDEQGKQELDEERFWCENCCNFDKEHVGMDGTATCKLTDNITWCQSSGKNCVGFNVPPWLMRAFPVLPGDKVALYEGCLRLYEVDSVSFYPGVTPQITMTRADQKVTLTVDAGRFRELVRFINGERVGKTCVECIHKYVCMAHHEQRFGDIFDPRNGGPDCRFFEEREESASK